MRQIQASEVKARLTELLAEVERGETLIITHHGRIIARIEPEADEPNEEVGGALASDFLRKHSK
jgi:prevent-host-death family protein